MSPMPASPSRLLPLLALVLAACLQPVTGPTTSTTAPAVTTSSVAADGTVLVGCESPPDEWRILCEGYDLIEQHYVDEIPDEVLAEAAERGVAELAEPGTTRSTLTCPTPTPAFVELCVEADRLDVAPEQAAEAALEGMARFALDPNSGYLDAEALEVARSDQTGTVEGVGALVTSEDLTAEDPASSPCPVISDTCHLVVVSVLPDSPAEAAGLQSGDVIVAVDGQPVAGWTVDEVTLAVRGPAGTQVRLGLERNGERLDLDITRARVAIPIVETALTGDLGLLRLNLFTDNADEEVEAALRQLLDSGAQRLVLDLRDDPGGSLEAAIGVASQFLAAGLVLVTEAPEGEVRYEVEPGGLATSLDLPLVVVVNRGSASASEVVAGVLQESGRAVVVGDRTFGKNTVQQRFALSNGGAMRLTVARWVTPAGVDFGEVGIAPDIAADLPTTMSPEEVATAAWSLAEPLLDAQARNGAARRL